MHRDYGAKGVKFFFVYKSLAHPELVGGLVQPFTLDERLAHARQAEKRLGSSIPWIVDAMDNRLKHALGDRPNSEFVIDPQGRVAVKRAWSFPAELRKDLERLVGKVDRITPESEVKLNFIPPPKTAAARGVVPPLKRPSRMQALVIEPKIDPKGQPFYAKLRAEADVDLMEEGAGKLYLGFHLDPLHEAHWNNLTEPLKFKLELPDGAKFAVSEGKAASVKPASDVDPREFLIDVANWPAGKPIKLTVTYAACVGETSCHLVRQDYVIHPKRDRDAGNARGAGAGYWDAAFIKQMMARDKNGDGKLSIDEVQGLVRPYFERFDTNKDGLLDPEELKAVLDWLNHHHEPGPKKTKGK